MGIIKTHDIALYSKSDVDIVLLPLCDEHLPLLYKWCADPEVLHWTEGGTADTDLSYDAETVHEIYGSVSQNAYCFLIQVNNVPIGDCWLQKMNLKHVKAMYPENLDVRRIDMVIGEKSYWNRGIGTQFIGMLIDFAFCGEHVDVLYCFCEDYNVRSRRMWEKHGFTRILEEPLEPQPQKGKWQYHYRLTRKEFIERRRVKVPADKQFTLPLNVLQPSQLYISEGTWMSGLRIMTRVIRKVSSAASPTWWSSMMSAIKGMTTPNRSWRFGFRSKNHSVAGDPACLVIIRIFFDF